MARANDYVDPDYDRRLAEYKALKAKVKQQGSYPQTIQSQVPQNQVQQQNQQITQKQNIQPQHSQSESQDQKKSFFDRFKRF